MNSFYLSGKTALVAGASRGIGLAIAQHLAGAGAHTTLAARSVDKLRENVAALEAKGCLAAELELDLADPQSIRSALEKIPTPDILVNVAGTNIRKPFPEYTQAEYDHIMRTNLHGIVELTQQVGARMVKRGSGKIIMIGSLMSVLGLPYLSVYAMTKGAIGQLTKALAAEWGRHNIQVNCIAPGFIVTDLNRRMWEGDTRMTEWLKGAQANPRLGTPHDVAPLAVFLAGAGADYVTGQIIAVDGGYTTTSVWPFEPGV